MAEGTEPVGASAPATDETTTASAVDNTTEDKTAAASADTTEESVTKGTTEGESTSNNSPGGEKRKTDDTADKNPPADTKPKKAKIAMPPKVSASVMDVGKYKLEAPPPEGNTNEADAAKKITTANLMLFGLHPLIKEGPLRKMLEDYGTVKAITVRSAFASRYGHVSFESVEEARKCYVAIHGAKLLHKAFLVQPSMASAETQSPAKAESSAATANDTAGAAAAAAAAVSTTSG